MRLSFVGSEMPLNIKVSISLLSNCLLYLIRTIIAKL